MTYTTIVVTLLTIALMGRVCLWLFKAAKYGANADWQSAALALLSSSLCQVGLFAGLEPDHATALLVMSVAALIFAAYEVRDAYRDSLNDLLAKDIVDTAIFKAQR